MNINTQIALFILIIIIDLIISAARSSYNNIRLARLDSLEEKDINIEPSLQIIKNQDSVKSSLKLVQSLLHVSITCFALFFLVIEQQNPLDFPYIALIILGITIIIWVIEFLIERGISQNPEEWLIRFTPLIRIIALLFAPFTFLPLKLAENQDTDGSNSNVIEQDVIYLIDKGQEQGALDQDEQKMISSILELNDTLAREIMIPRVDLFAIEENVILEDALDDILESGYSRIPVYRETIDHVVGFLYTKDILKLWQNGNIKTTAHSILREVNFIPEMKKADELLEEMQKERIHVAIIVDEYGGVAGLVTLEDIVEEIVGEIQDEYDDAEISLIKKINDDEFIINGRYDLDDFNNLMDCQFPTDESDTIGGLLYASIGHVPEKGESIQIDNIKLTIQEIEGQRIQTIHCKKINPEKEE